MKNWSLRTRITLGSAVFFAAAVALLGFTTVTLVRKHQIESLDVELQAELRSVLHEIDEHGVAGVGLTHALEKADPESRFYIQGPDGSTVFASPELGQEKFSGLVGGLRTFGKWRVAAGSLDGFVVRLARDFRQVDATVSNVRRAFVLTLPALLAFVGGTAWWLVRSALGPVQDISEAARRITAERLDQRLPTPLRQDEMGRLTDVLNEMLERIERGHQQAVRFTADASHELKTPLALMAAGLEELLRRSDHAPGVVPALGSLLEDNRRLSAICQDLLVLARADAGQLAIERRPADLAQLVEAAVEDARILAAPRDLEIELNRPAEACSEAVDERFVTRILLNLLSNAVKFSTAPGAVRVDLHTDRAHWLVDVANTGEPIPELDRSRVFERFYRSQDSNVAGHGLGLSLSRELARAHGGDLLLLPAESGWIRFRLVLPRSAAIPPRRETSRAVDAEAGRAGAVVPLGV